MTGILKVDQWKDSGDNTLMTSDGAGNLTSNTEITVKSTTDTPSIVVNNTNDGKARMTFQENGTNRLEIGLYGGIVSGTSGATVIKAHETLVFYDSGGETFRSQSGQILLGTTQEGSAAAGDVVLGGGIFIGGNANANKLDDYEEGTWTPTFTYTTTTPSFSYVTRSGRYTKIGRLVQIGFQLNVTSIDTGSASGEIEITGLPFPCKSQSLATGAVMVYAADVYANTYDVTINVQDNSSNFRFIQSRDNEGWINMSTANDAGQLVFQSSFVYDTDS